MRVVESGAVGKQELQPLVGLHTPPFRGRSDPARDLARRRRKLVGLGRRQTWRIGATAILTRGRASASARPCAYAPPSPTNSPASSSPRAPGCRAVRCPEASAAWDARYSRVTFAACGPFWPWVTS